MTFLPYSIVLKTNTESILFESLAEADEIYKNYRDARVDFHTEVSICRNLVKNNTTGYNKQFMDVLEAEIPEVDLDGEQIYASRNFMVDIKKGREVDESFIASRRNQLKLKFFLYKRKMARWYSLFFRMQALTEPPLSID